MKEKIKYYRLHQKGRFVGFSRTITDYLPAGESLWELDIIESDEKVKLTTTPLGIECLKRKKIIKRKKLREKRR